MTDIRIDEDVRIPMSDGVTLSARIWRPLSTDAQPVPAVLETIPYRKRDHTRPRDETLHRWLAERGYASVRVDIRGSGESGGVLENEYLARELEDGYALIEWLAAQPWCDGGVGMIGISWGGFNGLQIAAMQPPALKAVVTVCSTDDRYADDIHTMGGCLLSDNLSWSSVMFAFNSLPPDPQLRGQAWRSIWQQRLEANAPWLMEWLEHPRRDDYWRHGSVCEDYAAIRCPVLAVSGWADGYTNAVFRLLANLEVPCQGIVGPWSHRYPHLGEPGPAIGFQSLVTDWWDRWLKGERNSVDEAPRLRAWIQDADPPATAYGERPGRWVAEAQWPTPAVQVHTLHSHGDGSLAQTPADDSAGRLRLDSPLGLGLFAGKWCSYADGPDLPDDQRKEMSGGLVFETEPLEAPLELLGAPRLRIRLRAEQPCGQIIVRLCDTAPDGATTRVSYGVLNLRHREGHDRPQDLVAGSDYDVSVPLNHLGHRFAVGHRLQMALSTAYWPLIWPEPEAGPLSIDPAATGLELPVRAPTGPDHSPVFPAAPDYAPLRAVQRVAPTQAWRVHHELGGNAASLEVIQDNGTRTLEDVDLTLSDATREVYHQVEGDPARVSGEVVADFQLGRGDWQVATRTRTRLEADAETFYLSAELDAWESDRRVFSRNWQRRIPRRDG
ncbi:CocE/NonD family hydrolase [Spiribacter roseus]|uniref:CocE/NonD family hydrolase n=1 Tax=Spiribacter roseus TaxID=1855875 RepID=A0ABV3RX32_9GAMM